MKRFFNKNNEDPEIVIQSELSQQQASLKYKLRHYVVTALSIGALIFMGALIYKAYPTSSGQPDPDTVPLIMADPTPYKELPEDPGGMEIPFQDSLVLNHLDDEMSENLVKDSKAEKAILLIQEKFKKLMSLLPTMKKKKLISLSKKPSQRRRSQH